VTKSIPSNTCVSGYPAKPHILAKKIYAFTQNLPGLFKRVKQLEKEMAKLKSNTNGERQKTNG